jgi:hypothetical protein
MRLASCSAGFLERYNRLEQSNFDPAAECGLSEAKRVLVGAE